MSKFSENLPKIAVMGFLALGVFIIVNKSFNSDNKATQIAITIPKLSIVAKEGEELFNANCASCHGKNVAGTKQGPTLIHDIYNPGHHADEGFFRAAKFGVRAHHWSFGNMPPIDIEKNNVARIIQYIRELQVANGIATKKHTM